MKNLILADNLLPIHENNGEPTVDSTIIAKELNNEHRALLQLIQTHQKNIEKDFGLIAFEMLKSENQRGKPTRIAKLNEGQALFVATLAKNSKQAVIVKSKIVKSFLIFRQTAYELTSKSNSLIYIAENASKVAEGVVFPTSMGEVTNHVFIENGVLWAKLAPIARLYGYSSVPTHPNIGASNIRKCVVGKSEAWFVNLEGFMQFSKKTRYEISSKQLNGILQMYGTDVELPETNVFAYTFEQMLDIMAELTKSPVNKNKVQLMLHQGRKK